MAYISAKNIKQDACSIVIQRMLLERTNSVMKSAWAEKIRRIKGTSKMFS